jgi:hypothetical protein
MVQGMRICLPIFSIFSILASGLACDPDLKCPYGACDFGSDPDFDSDTGSEDVETKVSLTEGTPVNCKNAALREEAPFDSKRAKKIGSDEIGLLGGGILVGDFVGDGLQQIIVLGNEKVVFWWQATDGTFVDESQLRLPFFGEGVAGVTGGSVIDIDADGDLDIYLTLFQAENQLWLNDGTGSFELEDFSAGLDAGTHRTMSSAWADMDLDGDLDLVLGGFGPHPVNPFGAAADFEEADPVILLENMGDGSFEDVSERLPEAIHAGYQSNVSWIDLDGDSRQDLVVFNNYGWARPGTVVWNRESGFELDSGSAGFSDSYATFGVGLGDVNGDGSPDFLRAGYQSLSLLASSDGVWQELGPTLSLNPTASQDFGWGTAIADIDNDADLDFLVGYGHWDQFTNATQQADALYIQDDAGQFSDEADQWSFAEDGYTRGLVVADFNRDGWPDVVKQQLDAGASMLIARCGEAAWLGVELDDFGMNRFGVGAQLQVSAGGKSLSRWITAGGFSAFSSGPPEAIFGLGDATVVDSLTVIWPDGEVSTFSGLGVNQHLQVTREIAEP